MKKLTLVLLLIGGCTAQQSVPLTSIPLSSAPPGKTEVLVTFELPEDSPTLHSGSQRTYHSGSRWDVDLLTRQRVKRFGRDHGLTLRAGWPVASLGLYCAAYQAPESTSLGELQEVAATIEYVHRVQVNQTFRGMGRSLVYNDPLFKFQFGEHNDKLIQLHQHSRGAQVRVGIIDSQVDAEHPDLVGQISGQEVFARSASVRDRKHGTAMAGIIAAANGNSQGVVGVAPEAEVHIFGACRSAIDATACDSYNLARAIQAAIESDMQLLNMSLAGPYDPLLHDLVAAAQKSGVIVVAAENTNNPMLNFPASLSGVFSASGKLGFWFTHPEQLTTQAGGGYEVFRGTSVSAAGLTGVAVLLRALHSKEHTERVLLQLQNGCSGGRMEVFNDDACL